MIVEDEEDILLLYKDFLSAKGHEVTTTYLTGTDMLKEIDNVGSETYLIDYRLPGNKNGVDVAVEILNKFRSAIVSFADDLLTAL